MGNLSACRERAMPFPQPTESTPVDHYRMFVRSVCERDISRPNGEWYTYKICQHVGKGPCPFRNQRNHGINVRIPFWMFVRSVCERDISRPNGEWYTYKICQHVGKGPCHFRNQRKQRNQRPYTVRDVFRLRCLPVLMA